jgi:hypothetical protein
MLAVLLLSAIQEMYSDVLSVTSWLDPDASEAFAKKVMDQNGEFSKLVADPDNATRMVTVGNLWDEEANLRDYQWLRWFSLSAPLWVIANFVVCVYHTSMHVKKVAEKKARGSNGLVDSPLHDQTIFILALPLVYGLMSFKSVIRCWQININHVGGNGVAIFTGYLDRKHFLEEMYEANFMVGDIYETLGLIAFGKIISTVLDNNIKRESASGNSSETLHKLIVAMGQLTVAGVKLFCLSCLLNGLYTLTVTFFGYEMPNFMPSTFGMHVDNLGTLQTPEMEDKVKNIFLGFGFAASFAAIGNIMTVEEDFHDFLHNFSPSAKFWGTKILVTLAFMQSLLLMVIPPFSSWRPTYVNLFYATVLCFECFIIALLHIKAWDADESWYGDSDSSELHQRLLLDKETDNNTAQARTTPLPAPSSAPPVQAREPSLTKVTPSAEC